MDPVVGRRSAKAPIREGMVPLGDCMTLKTLGDVRSLLSHLPKNVRARSTWQHVAADLDRAAGGGDTINVSVPLQMVLGMERVERRK